MKTQHPALSSSLLSHPVGESGRSKAADIIVYHSLAAPAKVMTAGFDEPGFIEASFSSSPPFL